MPWDLLIRNGEVVDGSGNAAFPADVAIKQGKIAALGSFKNVQARRIIDARGQIVAPGFIDCHSHADLTLTHERHSEILEPLIRQGITTFIGGNCGISLAPLEGEHLDTIRDYLEAFTARSFQEEKRWSTQAGLCSFLERQGVALNVGLLAPHGVIRIAAMGLAMGEASSAAQKQMEAYLATALEAGAFGLSTGLQYFPGSQSHTEELIALGKVVHRYGGVFTSHLRSYSGTIGKAIDEVLEVSRRAEIPVQISHLFFGPDFGVWQAPAKAGLRALSYLYRRRAFPLPFLDFELKRQVQRVAKYIAQGQPIGMDAMPTSLAFTHLLALFPPWSLVGSRREILARLGDRQSRMAIYRSITTGDPVWPHRERDSWSMNMFKFFGWDCARIMSVKSEANRRWEGKTFVEVGRERGRSPFEAMCDLLVEEEGQVLIFISLTRPQDDLVERTLRAALLHPQVSLVTDTALLGFGRPHHLFYDCYPKVLGRYVREERLLSLPAAIRKMTSLPARQMQLKKRGWLAPGYYADAVVFDPKTVASRSTFDDPCRFPAGISHVLINGKVAVDPDGYHPDPKPGCVLYRGVD